MVVFFILDNFKYSIICDCILTGYTYNIVYFIYIVFKSKKESKRNDYKLCALLGKDKNELRNSENTLENRDKTIVELCYKYFTCGMIGFNTLYLLPNVFKLLSYHTADSRENRSQSNLVDSKNKFSIANVVLTTNSTDCLSILMFSRFTSFNF